MSNRTFEYLLDFDNPVFSSYAYWGSILVIKCLFMSVYTVRFRIANKVSASEEDPALMKLFCIPGEFKTNVRDPDIERVRRAHRNDLENILPYLFVGLFYVMTDPSEAVAKLLIQVAAVSRILHTLVYAVIVVPQPTRGIVWFIHYVITAYMAGCVILYAHTR